MGKKVVEAIQYFFKRDYLLKELNYTIIALVPKFYNNFFCKDFSLISCCNTIYKCITKILVNKLKGILLGFINKAQMAFVGHKRTKDNIFLC